MRISNTGTPEAAMGDLCVLFDLDGTITDSAEGIINSVCYALEKYGRKVEDKESLKCFVGPPLQRQFELYAGVSEAEGARLVELYREYYTTKGIFENQVYEGIIETVKKLRQEGVHTCIATSKPEVFAKRIAVHFGFDSCFEFIGGSLLDGGRVKKADVIAYVLECGGVKDKGRVWMVGDREHDILGAREAGIHSVGVLYGYGSRQELETAGAEYIVENPEDILGVVFAPKTAIMM